MKKTINIFTVLLLFTNFSVKINAQCSDAGICQLGGNPMELGSKTLLDVSASYKFGYSGKEDDVQFHSLQLSGNYNLLDNSSIQAAVPYNIQSGPEGNVSGIGDLILSWNQNLFSNENFSLDASAGIKLATGDDNKDSMPQVYQSGLGSNDLLFALNYTYDKISIGAGYQLAGGRNDNIYRLERGDDLLLRTAYNFQLDKFSINPQVLFIQRLAKSSILDTTSVQETFIEVENSDQAQLNLLVLTNYQVNNNFSLSFDFAVPFIKREVNVDGLTRALSASLGIIVSVD